MKISMISLPIVLLSLAGCSGDSDLSLSIEKGEKGNGKVKTESRPLSKFNSVSYDGVGEVKVSNGASPSFKVTCDDNLLTKIKTEVKDGKLVVTCKEISPTKLSIEIVTDSLESFSLNGAGAVEINDIKGQRFEAQGNGAGSFVLRGSVSKATLGMHGAGVINASDLKADDVIAKVNGAGAIQLNSEKTIDAAINGVGSIEYSGNATVVNKTIEGIGSIEKKGK